MKLGLVRIGWVLVAVGIGACHFPEAKNPDPDDATSQSNVTPTTMAGGAQTACDVARGVELVSALVSTLPHAHHAGVDSVPSVLLAEGECHRALAEKQAALEDEGQALEAQRLRLDQERLRDQQDHQLFDQLRALLFV